MIGLDIDGTVLPYGAQDLTRPNYGLLDLLPAQGALCALITNQAGICFHAQAPGRFPAPFAVAMKIGAAATFLTDHGYPVRLVLVSCWHPTANPATIAHAAAQLRQHLPRGERAPWPWHVYTTARARKPQPYMLIAARCVRYYGDAPEDHKAAQAAGIPFTLVPRWQ